MKKSGIFNITVLLLCALIWGLAFTAQSVGAEYVGPWTFLACRAWLGVATLIIFIGIRKLMVARSDMAKLARDDAESTRRDINGDEGDRSGKRTLLTAGFLTGVLLCMASFMQQEGISYTSVAKSSFITTLYVVIVPLISVILGGKVKAKIWLAVLFSVSGLYLLSFAGGFEAVNIGDLITMGCAVLFSLQIITVNHFVNRLDGLKLSCCEFFFEALVATAGMFIFEKPSVAMIILAFGAILYAGVMSNGIAYTLQIIGQRDFDPTIASLCMCMESVFGALGGFILLGQTLSVREIIGCSLMFIAILVAEMPVEKLVKGLVGTKKGGD